MEKGQQKRKTFYIKIVEKKRVYIGYERTEIENNCKSH